MSDRTLKVLITALAFFSLFFRLGETELRAEEPRRAAVSIEMMESGDLMKPTLTGYAYYNKPPLFNWVQLLVYKISGNTNENISRIPGILSVLATAILIYLALARAQLKRIAFYAMIIFLSFADLLFYGTVNAGEIDLFFTLLIFIQVALLYLGESRRKISWILLSYAVLGLAFLTKGFPAYWFQATAVLACWIGLKRFTLKSLGIHSLGALVSFAVLSFYYIPLENDSGMALCYIKNLVAESGQRSALGFGLDSIVKNAALFPLNFFKLLLPWSLFLVYFIFPQRNKVLGNPIVRTSILFVLFSLPVFWFTGEIRNRYLYPLFPFAGIILAYILELSKERLNSIKMMDLLFVSIPGMLAIGCVAVLLKLPELAQPQLFVVLFGGLFAILFFLSFRFKLYRLHLTLISIFCLKILYSATFLPASTISKNEEESYRSQLAYLIEQADNALISLELPAQIIGKGNCALKTAPILPYQYPYYYYQLTGEILKQDVSRGSSMLLKDELMEDNFSDGIGFKDRQGQEYLLISDF